MATIAAPAPTAARPSALEDRAFFGHPRGLGLLFVTEMWERFSYYGMRAILILYLVNAAGWEKTRATDLYGTYTMLVFLTPLLGGYLADKYIGTRRSLVIGAAVIALGHFALAFPGSAMFYAGLGLIVVGTGFFKPNVSTMVGQLYAPGDPRRDAGFTIFYIGINTGAFLGPLVCAYLAQTPRFGWHWGFSAAGVGMVLGLLVCLRYRDAYLPGIGVGVTAPALPTAAADSVEPPAQRSPVHGAAGAAVGAAAAWLTTGGSGLGLLVGTIIGGAIGVAVLGTRGEERNRVVALFIVAFFVAFFWASYEQQGSSFALFADRSTDLVVGGFTIPSGWFQSVNPFCILAFSPLFAWLWVRLGNAGREPSVPVKMIVGLALVALSFGVMMVGGGVADAGVKVSPWWLVGAMAIQTVGELCISPVGLSYVTKVAPWQFASLLMGVWFLANAVANKLAGWLAGYTPLPGETAPAPAGGIGGFIQATSATNRGFFSIFLWMSLAATLLLLAFTPLLKRLTRTVKA